MSMKSILNRTEEVIKDKGNYFEALPRTSYERNIILGAIDRWYEAGKIPKADREMAEQLMSICNSYYEYGTLNAGRTVPFYLNESYYGKLQSVYNESVDASPQAIIPKGLDKVDQVHKKLANNVDKAYRIYKSDPIPNGVAEKGAVESLVKDAFKAAGLDKKKDELEVVVRPKVDGVSIAFETNKEEEVKESTTRGKDGKGVQMKAFIGEKILPVKNTKIQTEMYTTHENFQKLKELMDTNYTAPRNAVSGIQTRLAANKDPELLEKVLPMLSFYPIEYISDESAKKRFKNLEQMGLNNPIPMGKIIKGNFKKIMKEITKEWEELIAARPNLEYDIDGLVITILDEKVRKALGRKKSTNKFQIALKFPPVSGKGIIIGFTQDYGKLGRRTIKSVLREPVVIGGQSYTTAQFKTLDDLHSREYHVGDECKFVRVGDAIPHIIFDDECEKGTGEKIKIREKCASCNSNLVVVDGFYECQNEECNANRAGIVLNFIEKVGLEGYGPEFCDVVINVVRNGKQGLIDIWNLDEESLKKAGAKKKVSESFHDDLVRAMAKLSEYELLGCLGMKKIGAANGLKIMSAFDLEGIQNLSESAMVYHLQQVDGIGSTMSLTMASELNAYREVIKFYSNKINTGAIDYDAVFVIGTTDLSNKQNKKIAEIAKKKGWAVTKNKKFSLLVAENEDTKTSKVAAAKKMEKEKDIKIIYTYKEFMEKYGEKPAK